MSVETPLYVAPDESYIFVSLGTPPQEVMVLMDSGSSTLAVPVPWGSCSCIAAPACVPMCLDNSSSSPPANCSPPVGSGGRSACSCSSQPCFGQQGNKCFPECAFPLNSSNITGSPCIYGSYSPTNPYSRTASNFSLGGTCCPTPPCGDEVTYGDNSGFEGLWVKDVWTIGSLGGYVPFVSITTVQNGLAYFQEAPAGGILGLAYDSINSEQYATLDSYYSCSTTPCSSAVPSAVTSWFQNVSLPNIVTLCFNTANTSGMNATTVSTSGIGTATFGDVPTGIPFQYAAIVDQSYYVVNVTHLTLGAAVYRDAAALNTGQAIVDTGNGGLLTLPTGAASAVCISMNASSCTSDDECSLTIHLQLDHAAGSMPVLIPGGGACVNRSCACQDGVTPGSQLVLGYLALRAYVLVLDRQQNRVGFAPTRACDPPCALFSSRLTCESVNYCRWAASSCVNSSTSTVSPTPGQVVTTLAPSTNSDRSTPIPSTVVSPRSSPTPTTVPITALPPALTTAPSALPAGDTSSSSSFNATAFLVVVPLLLALAFGASFIVHVRCRHQARGGHASYEGLEMQ